MGNIEIILEIQEKLLVLIKKYEVKSRNLLDCEIDEIPLNVNSRENILKRIGFLTKEIERFCDENTNQLSAFKNDCDRSILNEGEKKIFDLRQQFNIYAFRTHSLEPEIIQRIETIRNDLMKKIKENNASPTAKAAKFYNAGLKQGNNLYFPENKKKI